MTTGYQQRLSSADWFKLKNSALQRAGNRCEGQRETDCSHEGPFPLTRRCAQTKGLQLHHLHYHTVGVEGLADVAVLCDFCHMIETVKQWKCPRCRDDVFLSDEEVIQWLRLNMQTRAILCRPGFEGIQAMTVSDWLKFDNRCCNYCTDTTEKDD